MANQNWNDPNRDDQYWNHQNQDYQNWDNQNESYQNQSYNNQGYPNQAYNQYAQNQDYQNQGYNQYGQGNNPYSDQNYYEQKPFYESVFNNSESFSQYLSRIFILMFLGLGVTTLVAIGTIQVPALFNLAISMLSGVSYLFFTLVYLGVVIALGRSVSKLNTGMALVLFFTYAVLTGFIFSMYGILFGTGVIWKAFLAAATFFGLMALFGAVTNKDLSSWRNILLVGLLAIIIVSIINIFLGSSTIDFLIPIVGVVIFMGYTAFDVNRLKQAYYSYSGTVALSALAVYGAFSLYLDFINLFLYLLRIFARSSSND